MAFQGKAVSSHKLQLTGGAKDLMFGDAPEIDEIIEVTFEGRVTGVDHRVNEKTGDLEAIVRVKAIDIGGIKSMSSPNTTSVPATP